MKIKARQIVYKLLCLVLFSVVSLDAFAQTGWESIVLASDIWKFKAGGSPINFDFTDPDFNDDDWMSGPGGIGYGDGDDATIIDRTNVLKLRKSFVINDAKVIERLLLDIDYDDGFVAYLNGIKIANSPNLQIDGSTVSLSNREAVLYSGGLPDRYEIDQNLLLNGRNVLAIQINNFGDDLSVIPFLNAEVKSTNPIFRDVPDWFIPPVASSELSSNLPLVVINTSGQTVPDEPKIVATMGIVNNGVGSLNKITDAFTDYNGRIAIEVRGQSSQMFPKKSYQFETQDELGENNNVSLLGFPPENDWILYGPYSDKSLLRNVFTFKMAERMEEYYASRTAYCELILNGEYQGVYVLMEKIKRDKGRVDIATLNPDEIFGDDRSGGYILKVDKTDDINFSTDGWQGDYYYQYVYPKAEDLVAQQKEYLSNFMSNTEDAINSSTYTNREEGYNKYLNVGSFVDFLLINELSKNVDSYRFSTYFHKKNDRNGGELFAGPIWDFNLGYGNVNYWSIYGEGYELWAYDILESTESRIAWWKRLMKDAHFANLVYTRWQDLRANTWSDENVTRLIDSLVLVLNGSQQRNYVQWPILGTYIWPNYDWQNNNYGDEVAYFKNWLLNRMEWMDNNLNGNLLQPVAEISINEENKSQLNLSLTDEYFNHSILDKKYFSLQNAPEGVVIDTIVWLNASNALVSLATTNTNSSASTFSIQIDNDILNGFKNLTTNSITLNDSAILQLTDVGVDVYAHNNVIYIRSNRLDVLPNEVAIYSSLGQLEGMYPIQNQYENKVQVGLSTGVYFVQVYVSGKPLIKKVVLQN